VAVALADGAGTPTHRFGAMVRFVPVAAVVHSSACIAVSTSVARRMIYLLFRWV